MSKRSRLQRRFWGRGWSGQARRRGRGEGVGGAAYAAQPQHRTHGGGRRPAPDPVTSTGGTVEAAAILSGGHRGGVVFVTVDRRRAVGPRVHHVP
ncbi:hypothetical protein ON010_g17668 [Phytophthora cinnamomi]|nr:hypothetical protein ON010_g17668 [Phytophthora cinnamomi]